jgi:hypothetical protein
MSEPAHTVDETEPIELIETDEPGDEPPAGWDPYAHDEEDRGADVEVTE